MSCARTLFSEPGPSVPRAQLPQQGDRHCPGKRRRRRGGRARPLARSAPSPIQSSVQRCGTAAGRAPYVPTLAGHGPHPPRRWLAAFIAPLRSGRLRCGTGDPPPPVSRRGARYLPCCSVVVCATASRFVPTRLVFQQSRCRDRAGHDGLDAGRWS